MLPFLLDFRLSRRSPQAGDKENGIPAIYQGSGFAQVKGKTKK